MKLRRMVRCLAVGALTAATSLAAMPPAHAAIATSGNIEDAGSTTATDVVDFIKHATNSFRPSTSPYPSPYTSYQRACTPQSSEPAKMGGTGTASPCLPFDIDSSQISSDNVAKTFTFRLTTLGNVPTRGAPITAIPAPFNSVDYEWYFATTTQETPHKIGITCGGDAENPDNEDDFTVGNPPPTGPARTGVRVNYTAQPHFVCPSASTPDKESKGISDGTKKVRTMADVMTVPFPAGDGWLANVAVTSIEGTHNTPRLDGGGTLTCNTNPSTGQPWPKCIDYDLSIGIWEQMASAGQSNSMKDFDVATKAKMSLSVSGKVVTATIPWNPTIITADGDGYVDDARSFPWELGRAGAKITRFIADTNGGMGAGVNLTPIQAICTDSTDNPFPEAQPPINQVGAVIGQANRLWGSTTNTVIDTVNNTYDSFPEPIDDNDGDDGVDPPPADDGLYIFGSGGTEQGDCIRGTLTLGTLLDWTDNAFELRIYPRQPSYLPSPTSLQCRYPLGRQNGVVVTFAPTNAPSVDVNTSPFDQPYNVQVFANSATPAITQNGTVIADPAPISPLAGQVGKNQECKYTYHAPGMHYFDTLPDFFM